MWSELEPQWFAMEVPKRTMVVMYRIVAFTSSTAVAVEFAVGGTDLEFKVDRMAAIQVVEVACRAISWVADRYFVAGEGTAVGIR